MSSIISWIVFGLIAGIIARLLMPGRDPSGCVVTMVLGIVGAFVGGIIYGLFTTGHPLPASNSFSLGSFAIAVLGAIVVLLIYRLVAGRRT